MCGILGIFSPEPVAPALLTGLHALQHRGQDAAGIVTWDGQFHTRKGVGLVPEVIGTDLEELPGSIGLAHVRYATQGSMGAVDAQPLTLAWPPGLAMVHNGNVTNFKVLRDALRQNTQTSLQTANDVELMLHALAAPWRGQSMQRLQVVDIFDAVSALQAQVEGAYSAIAVLAGRGLLAFRDRLGIRPLVLGQRQTSAGIAYAFASESTCFTPLGYDLVRELAPGEAVLVDSAGQLHRSGAGADRGAFCAFEFIYFASPDATMNGTSVAERRRQAGQRLARQVRQAGLQPEVVVDVPNSAWHAAAGLADALNLPHIQGLIAVGPPVRSFLGPHPTARLRTVQDKLQAVPDLVAGRRVAVVDDSIVRGTTAKYITRLLQDAGAAAVYFLAASPPVLHRCAYGIDLPTRQEILANGRNRVQIQAFIGADAVLYQDLADLQASHSDVAGCFACFSGDYPTELSAQTWAALAEDRQLRQDLTAPNAERPL